MLVLRRMINGIRGAFASGCVILYSCFFFCSIEEQEQELIQLKAENDLLRKQRQPTVPALAPKGTRLVMPLGILLSLNVFIFYANTLAVDPSGEDNAAACPMMSSVTKVVQPTATVSSVPVSGPSKFICILFAVEMQEKKSTSDSFVTN